MSKKLKIAFVCGWYSGKFGYIHNNLPRSLVNLNIEVHIITSTSQQYSNSPDYEQTYQKFLGPKFTQPGQTIENGVFIHRNPVTSFKSEILPKDLFSTLKIIKPDIVHIFDVGSLLTFKLALYRPIFRYKLITSNHILNSVFPLATKWKDLSILSRLKWFLLHKIPGRYIYSQTNISIHPSSEGLELSQKFFGYGKKKNMVKSLAVDTNIFLPFSEEKKRDARKMRGFQEDDFIIIYTGRFSEDKNPLILANAINKLRTNGILIKGIFTGDGVQKEAIEKIDGCYVFEFADQAELACRYAMSDLGVWPRQESTSMLDCISCGVPIIVNDTVKMRERIDGNGLYYKCDDVDDLGEQIIKLYKDDNLRTKFSIHGRQKVMQNFSWNKYAQEYIDIFMNDK